MTKPIFARIEKQKLKQLFFIDQLQEGDNAQKVLSLKTGRHFCGFALTNRTGETLYKLGYYELEKDESNFFPALTSLHPELLESYYEVLISYNAPVCTLVPASHFSHEKASAILHAVAGADHTETIIAEHVPSWQLHTVYGVPSETHEWITRHFRSGKYWHQHSIGLRNALVSTSNGHIVADIDKDSVSVLAAKDGKLVIASNFAYTSPSDILYQLVLLCEQSGLSREEAELSLSGLIDRDSALYKELYQHFLKITFRESPWATDHPSHFFTSLNDIARCAS